MTQLSRERLGGIGDEAAVPGERQVALHAELRLGFVELRNVGGRAIADLLPQEAIALAKCAAARGLKVGGLASGIGNWSRRVGESFAEDQAELVRLATLAPIFGTRLVRVMTYLNDGRTELDYEREVLRQFRTLGALAREYGLLLLVENCGGWVQHNPARYSAVEEAAGSDVTRVLFDIGNPVAYGYDGFVYLEALMPRVAHIHIKDARRASHGTVFTLPGEGDARLEQCVNYALDQGYAGLFSLEPHIATTAHLAQVGTAVELEASYRIYLQRFLALFTMC